MLVWRLGFLVFIQVVQVRSLGGESRSHFTPPLAAASPGSARSTMCRHALPQGMICSRDFPFPAELKAFFSCSSLPLLQDPLVSQAALSLLGSWIVRVWLLSGNSCLVCIEQLSPSIALFPGLSQEITLTVHGGLSLKGSTATLILLLSSCPQSHQPNKNSRNLHYGNRSQRWGGGSWQQLSQSCHLTPPESHCPQEGVPCYIYSN